MRLGIDASNLRAGGGITHLASLLDAARPADQGIERVLVWAPRSTLAQLPARDWLDPRPHADLEGRSLRRLRFQNVTLAGVMRDAGVDVAFVPGGIYAGRFRPFVTMFRNMLPFAPREAGRYGLSPIGVRLRLLRGLQADTFRRADGVVCLSDFAASVLAAAGVAPRRQAVIPHGVDDAFRAAAARHETAATAARPLKLLYVSIVDLYKHQWNVAEAVLRLRRRGVPVVLDLIGPAYEPAMRRVQAVLDRYPEGNGAIRYAGAVPRSQLPAVYAAADAFVFASTCENMPNILLEAMAAGLPIASSDRRPMPDVLGAAGLYFDPENVESIERALAAIAADPARRRALGEAARDASRPYSWARCAGETLAFIRAAAA